MLAGHKFTWSFLRAAVSFPIIGIDFLIHHSLLLDAACGRLSAPSSGIYISLSRQSSSPTATILLPELLAASVPATAPAAAAMPSAPSAAPTAAFLLPEPSAATLVLVLGLVLEPVPVPGMALALVLVLVLVQHPQG
jgi:hypothetical protein